MTTRILLGTVLALFGLNAARAEIFDENRCGTMYPKMPTDTRYVPTTVFKSTDMYGITSDFHPLVCKGGSSLRIEREITFPMQPSQVIWPVISLYFNPSTKAGGVDGANLNPGECAWILGPIKARSSYVLTDNTYYPGTKMKSVTAKDATGRMTTEMSFEPKIFEVLQQTNSVVAFYVSPLTWTTLPFCEQRPLGIHATPYMRVR
ncbi:MAG: hypothetical protein JNL01_13535 [Bdellovibrionales bacterium]|nr:hypothetical protein [Bdellovibrionales bacterium]